jgi:ABC-2 type transport system permease protein
VTPFWRLVFLVAGRDYLRTVKRRGFLAGTLILPLVLGLIGAVTSLASAGSAGAVSGPIYVVNESNIQLDPDARLTPHVTLVTRPDAETALETDIVDTYFVVPGTWPGEQAITSVQHARAGGTSPIDALTRQDAQRAEVELLLRISLLKSQGLPDSVLTQLLTPVALVAVDQQGNPVSDAGVAASFLVPYVFTLIFIVSLFITSGYLLQSVTEEKENRVVEIILSSVRPLPLMAGKIIGLGAAGLTQVAIWVVTGLVAIGVFNQRFELNVAVSPVTLSLALIVFVLGYLGYGAIFAAIGALAPGAREGQQYGSFFGFLAVIPLVLLPVFINDLGSPVVVALCLLPLTAPAALLEVLAISGSIPWPLVVASLVSQLAFVSVAVVASARVFRATVLLYGVRPTAQQLAGAIFGRS